MIFISHRLFGFYYSKIRQFSLSILSEGRLIFVLPNATAKKKMALWSFSLIPELLSPTPKEGEASPPQEALDAARHLVTKLRAAKDVTTDARR